MLAHSIDEERQNLDILAPIDNYTFFDRQTHKKTDRHGNPMTNLAWFCEKKI